MESKFQDLLKNIVPGFFLSLNLIILVYCSGFSDLTDVINNLINLPIELFILVLPFSFFLIGYLNDIISSQIEFWMYNYLKSPSWIILNNKSSRYRIVDLNELKSKLAIEDTNEVVSNEIAYEKFQMANQLKENNDDVAEFYLSYIFSRNLMVASLLILLSSLIILFVQFNVPELVYFICVLIVFVMFFHRWIQRSKYYTKKVFLSFMKKK